MSVFNCNIKYKKIIGDTYQSTKNSLVAHKFIDEYNNILDTNKFRLANTELSDYASKKLGISIRLYTEENNKALPYREVFKELDRTNSNKEILPKQKILEGVDFVYSQNPELESIGSKEEYSEYLKTIFPKSKVQDIVYRAGASSEEEYTDEITDYLDLGSGYYFSPNKNIASTYGKPNAFIINVKNIKPANIAKQERVDFFQNAETFSLVIPTLDDNGKYDSIIDTSKSFRDTYELVVFKEENFFKLGNSSDIEGFKKFVGTQNNILETNPEDGMLDFETCEL